ncbi:MAG: thiamine phosphate synthase [Mariprofundaceae bacterium]|nr:thiamine phosphate synthase [Mariprofundaceae bacterium]
MKQKVFTLPKLVFVTHNPLKDSQKVLDVFEQALDGGVDAILLREPELVSSKLLALASQLRVLTQKYHAKLMIHSHADVAQAVAADGVHVRASDMHEIRAMKAWLQDDMLFSASCHDLSELAEAKKQGADYAFLSPVFATESHLDVKGMGIQAFKEIAGKSPLPVIALGGVDEDNRTLLAGFSVATIRALLLANEPFKAAQALRKSE